jgi:hypothetical protein
VTVKITCPSCHFSKEIPRDTIPVGARWVTCPRCKRRFEFAAAPPAPQVEQEEEREVPEDDLRRGPSPWEDRTELGIWQGIYATFKGVLFSPDRLFGSLTYKGGIKEPLAIGLLFGSIGSMFGTFWNFLIEGEGAVSMGHDLLGYLGLNLMFLLTLILTPFFVLLIMFVTSGILHLFLLIVRAGHHGFEGTFRVVAFSQATQILGVVPFIGGIVGALWYIVVQIIGLRQMHETSYLRVITALILPIVLVIPIFLAVWIPFFFFAE